MKTSAALSEKYGEWYARFYYDVEDDIIPVFEKLDTPFLDKRIGALQKSKIVEKGQKNGKSLYLFDAMMGRGRHAVRYASKGCRVRGNDYNKHMVAIVKKMRTHLKLSDKRLRLTNHDVRKLPIKDNTFDTSIAMFSSVGTIPGKAERQRALDEISRVTKPGGIVIIHAHNFLDGLFEPGFAGWAWKNLFWPNKGLGRGDIITDYNGLNEMFNHFYRPGEFRKSFRKAGLDVIEEAYMDYGEKRFISGPLKTFKADGFIFVGQKR